MSHWKTETALHQAERDLFLLNERDREIIDQAKRRIEGRTRLLKILRRRFRRQGLVSMSSDSGNPHWVHKDMLPVD